MMRQFKMNEDLFYVVNIQKLREMMRWMKKSVVHPLSGSSFSTKEKKKKKKRKESSV